MTALDRYHDNINNPQAPGNGCHSWILSTANLGTIAGVEPSNIFTDIRRAIPPGKRRIADREINEAIQKALRDLKAGTFTPQPRPQPITNDGPAARRRIIGQSKVPEEVDLWESSPIRIDWEPADDAAHFIANMFAPDDLLFIGDRLESGVIGENIRPTSAWLTFFNAGGIAGPFIIINPLSGQPAQKKSGDGETFRGDANVKTYRFCLAEFDTMSREDQIAFWSAAKLPIRALIDTGGKSIHAWIRTDNIGTPDAWSAQIRRGLYERALIPMGVDAACSNPARLSRLPGYQRPETKNFQRLLWLS